MHRLLRRPSGASRDLLSNASSLIGTTVITAGLGFVYWWLAARQFSQVAVGVASALISAMSLLGSLGMLGLGTLLIGELPRRPQQRVALLTTGLLVAAVLASLLGFLFVLLAPVFSAEFQILHSNLGALLLFPLGVALTSITLVLDQALIGLMRGGMQLGRNALFAVLKLVFLVVLGSMIAAGDGMLIYATWAAGNLVSLLGIVWFARQAVFQAMPRPDFGLLRELPGAALWHHALNLALQLPGLVLPLVVTALLSAEQNASFYMCWLTLHFVYAIPYTLSTVLFAAGAATTDSFAQKTRFTLAVSIGLGLLTSSIIWFGAEYILGIFGAQYAAQAGWALRIMALGVFPLIVKDHYVAISRVAGTIPRTALIAMLGSLLELGAAAFGASIAGLAGLATGFVVALCLEMLYMIWAVYYVVRPASRTAENLVSVASAGSIKATK